MTEIKALDLEEMATSFWTVEKPADNFLKNKIDFKEALNLLATKYVDGCNGSEESEAMIHQLVTTCATFEDSPTDPIDTLKETRYNRASKAYDLIVEILIKMEGNFDVTGNFVDTFLNGLVEHNQRYLASQLRLFLMSKTQLPPDFQNYMFNRDTLGFDWERRMLDEVRLHDRTNTKNLFWQMRGYKYMLEVFNASIFGETPTEYYLDANHYLTPKQKRHVLRRYLGAAFLDSEEEAK